MLLIKGGMLQQICKEHSAVWHSITTHELAYSTLFKKNADRICVNKGYFILAAYSVDFMRDRLYTLLF